MIPKAEAFAMIQEMQVLLHAELHRRTVQSQHLRIVEGELRDLCHLFLLVVPLLKKSAEYSELLGEDTIQVGDVFLFPLCCRFPLEI